MGEAKGVWTQLNYNKAPSDADRGKPKVMEEQHIYGEHEADKRQVFIHDIRGQQDNYNFVDNGFQYVEAATNFNEWDSQDAVKAKYYPELCELIKKALGAKEVFAWQSITRSTSTSDCKAEGTVKTIIPRPHIDTTATVSRAYLDLVLPQPIAQRFKESKVVNISAWRPLNKVERDPLGVVDTKSYQQQDLILLSRPADIKGAPEVESYVVDGESAERHYWCYLDGQTPDEVLLLKLSDERQEHPAGVPHSAFAIEGTENLPGRQSIEVRCVCAF